MKIINGKQSLPPRVVIAGVEKSGKSTFAAQWPESLVMPVKGEQGVDALDCRKTETVESWDQLMEMIGWVYENPADIGTLVLDSASSLQPLIWAEVCKREQVATIEKVGGGWGKGYTEAGYLWRELLEALDALRCEGVASVIISHVVVRSVADPLADPYDAYELDLHKGAAALLLRWADSILFLTSRVLAKKDEYKGKETRRGVTKVDRVLCTQKAPGHPGGGRGVFGKLPAEIVLGGEDGMFEQFKKEMEAVK